MENSSSSKTRSPARVLAALLAVVMLFIVMPVLPAGAYDTDGKIHKIVFKDVKEDGDIFFDPDETSNNVNEAGSKEPFKWTGVEDITARSVPGVDSTDIELTSDTGFGTKPSDNIFAFGLFTSKPNATVYYALEEQGTWTPLTPSDETKLYKRKNCNVYVLPQAGMTGTDVFIKVESSFTATFSIADGITVKAGSDQEKLNAIYDSESIAVPAAGLYFEANVGDGYEADITVSGGWEAKPVEQKENMYSVTGFDKNFTVKVERVKKQYTVHMTFSENTDGYSILEDVGETNLVSHGEKFTFTVATDLGYNAPNVTVKEGQDTSAKDYDDVKIAKNGSNIIYTIRSITKDLYVTVGEAVRQPRKVTFSAENGFKIEFDGGSGTYGTVMPEVKHGDTIKFKLTRLEGWSGTPRVTANGSVVTGSGRADGPWTYSYTVEEDTDFDITGLTQNTYTVSIIPQQDVFTLTTPEQIVRHGNSVTFTMMLSAGWKLSTENSITLKNNGVSLDKKYNVTVTPIGGSAYTIKIDNIDAPLALTAEGFEKTKVNVTVNESDGFEVKCENRKQNETGAFEVPFGEGVTFTITVAKGYTIESVTATTNGNTEILDPHGSGKNQYSVNDVKAAVEVEVSVRKLTYTIEHRFTSSVTMDGSNGSLSVKKEYTIGDGIVYEEQKGLYTLTFAEPTRKGWNFEGWKNENYSNPVKSISFPNFTEDMADTFDAEWTVDVSTNPENAFFSLQLTNFSWSEKDEIAVMRFEATVNTNLKNDVDKTDAGGTAKVLAHGFFFGQDKETLEAALAADQLDAVKQKLQDGAKDTVTALPEAGNVVYFKHDDEDPADLFENGAKFSLNMTKAPENGAGAAWVIVEIDGKTYLIVSAVDDTPEKA